MKNTHITIRNFFSELNDLEVNYCHWKSNQSIGEAFRGNTDLDILVDSKDKELFLEQLKKFNIIKIHSQSENSFPHIEDYLGFDYSTGKLFHIHLHYKLVIGRKFTKDYIIPYTDFLMENTNLHPDYPIKIPHPICELFILVIRILLKQTFGLREIVKNFLSKNPIYDSEKVEIDFLLNQFKLMEYESFCKSHVSEKLLILTINFLENYNNMSYYEMRLLSKNVKTLLEKYKMNGEVIEKIKHSYRKYSFSKKVKRNSHKKTLSDGNGFTIALIGIDGSGKSTVSKELLSFLSWKLNVELDYLGKQRNGLLYIFFSFVSRVVKKFKLSKFNVFADNMVHISGAVEKSKKYKRIFRKKNQGLITLIDRFPIKMNPNEFFSVDYCKIRNGTKSQDKFSFLSKIEKKIYDELNYPDLFFFLDVSLDVARHRRNFDSNYERTLKKKMHTLKSFSKGHSNLIVINSDQSKNEVLLETKRQFWDNLCSRI